MMSLISCWVGFEIWTETEKNRHVSSILGVTQMDEFGAIEVSGPVIYEYFHVQSSPTIGSVDLLVPSLSVRFGHFVAVFRDALP